MSRDQRWGRPSGRPQRDFTQMSDTPLLELRNLTKSFGSVQALSGVDMEVRSGEVMALVGDNGAGKSTLIKCIAGTHSADSGEIVFEGREVNIHGPKAAARLGIEVVYQDLALCDNPPRRVAHRRPHHRPRARPERGLVRSPHDDAAGGRGGDHRGHSDEGGRNRDGAGARARVTTVDIVGPGAAPPPPEEEQLPG